ncbi:uncharacterized protein LOC113751887 [Coffea eugenioides]|uniref:uncharacterized protein LOC113751887 n=1 Tax=Coffea eugenioides TaxID=49369 RepID=UPI000F6137AF|nr:uncharacterized protein LOC113751887 [Coffea eugenioides]
MKNLFQNIGVWNIVETGYTKPVAGIELSSDAVKELERNRQLDYKAMYYLNTQVQLHVAKKFIHAKSAKEAWKILVNSNRGATKMSKIRLQELRRQFELAQMKSTESIKDFIGTIKEIFNDMESNGENLEKVRVVEKVLRSLTAKFYTKKTVLEATKDFENLSLAELEGELLTYEMSLNQQPSDTVEEVLQAKVDHPKGKEEVNRMDTNQWGQNFRGRGRGGRDNFRGRGGDYLRKKLDDKAEKCIFIGYSHETKGYKLFNPNTGKVIVSRDIMFDEHGVWDWSRKDLKTSPKYPSISPIMGPSASKQVVEQVVHSYGDPSTSTIQVETSSRP